MAHVSIVPSVEWVNTYRTINFFLHFFPFLVCGDNGDNGILKSYREYFFMSIMGHPDVQTTMDIYNEIQEAKKKEALKN